jgi:L-ascorbate metabolism protein UlaG (beta-lactamase superfamily)
MSPHPRPKFTYLGHSTIRCDMPDGNVLLIDPWVESNPACPQALHDLGRVDAILITHGHSDHLGDALTIARRCKPRMVVANHEIYLWLARHGISTAVGMNLGGTLDVLGNRVTMVRADHTSSIEDGGNILNGGVANGYVVRLPGGYSFYHAGDTALFSDMQLIGELWRPELAFLPIGDIYTMDPQQAARACRYLGVRRVIPIHWGTFPALTGTPAALEAAILDLGVASEVVGLAPGESF